MKKRLSLFMAMIMAATNFAFVTMSSVSAQNADYIVSDDFETGYTHVLSTNAATTLEAMQEVCDMNPWWYSANASTFNKREDIDEKNNPPLIACVVGSDGNNALRIAYHSTAGIGTNITTPSLANQFDYEDGSYEVSFRFYATGNMRIYGVGYNKDLSEYYHHNILTKTDAGAYIGDTSGTSADGGIGGTGIKSNKWYTVKVIVNNDQDYYSVEFTGDDGTSQRVGGINFKEGCPAISNIRFQTTTEDAVTYIDNYTVKKVARDNLLYKDSFNHYSAFSGKSGTYTVGANLFKEISQFRVQDKNSNFMVKSSDGNKYLGFDAKKADDTKHYPANVMYMPWEGYILTNESQNTRGKLQLKFSFAINDVSTDIATASPSFRVICADELTTVDNLAKDEYTMFMIKGSKSGDTWGYGIHTSTDGYSSSSHYTSIKAQKWYDVQMTFDLINNKVDMEAKQRGVDGKLTFSRPMSLFNGGTALNSIKSVMLKASEGIQIFVDDFELKYVNDALHVKDTGADVLDFDGNKVIAGATDVNPAIATIKVPFTGSVSSSVDNITLKAENSDDAFAGYTTTNVNGTYTMNFNKTLAPNTKYILTVPTTVTSIQGAALAEEYTYEFTTGNGSASAEMAVNVGIKTIDEIQINDTTKIGKIQVKTKYSNTTNTPDSCLIIVACYDANNTLIGSVHADGNIPENSIKMNFNAELHIPATALNKASRLSVYLWDSCDNMVPYCESIDIFRATDGE